MIILAATVVISLNNTGIIDKASQAVQLTDEKQVQDLASMLWAEAYLDEKRTDTIENVVKAELEKHGVTDANWNIIITDNGVNVTKKENSTNDDSALIENQLSGIWLFNETLNITSAFSASASVTFITNGKTYNYMAAWYDKEGIGLDYRTTTTFSYDTDVIAWTFVEGAGNWKSEAYRTVDFGTEAQEVPEEFYDWFIANATKQ